MSITRKPGQKLGNDGLSSANCPAGFSKRRARRAERKPGAEFVGWAEALERRVLLSAAIAALGDQQTFTTRAGPEAVVLADMDRDGKLDAVEASTTEGTVSVFPGDGIGRLPGERAFGAASGAIAVGVADFNGDGRPDVVAADYSVGKVSVFAGDLSGVLRPLQPVAVGLDPIALATGDVNGDGKADVLVANYGSGTVSVLLGNGNGTFNVETVNVGAHPISVATADLNGDGKLDLAVTNYQSNTVSVLLGNGDGSFVNRLTFSTGAQPRDVVAGDMNDDGKLDLVVSNRNGNSVGVLLGTGTGTFGAQQTYATGTTPRGLSVADVNLDGKLDVVTANGGSGNVSLLLGNGDGSLAAQKTFGTLNNPFWPAVGDMNGDGRPDVVVADQAGNDLAVMLGDVPPVVTSINRLNPVPSTGASSVKFAVTFSEAVSGVDATDFAVATTGSVTSYTPVVSGLGANYTVTVNGVAGNGILGLNLVDDGSIRNAAGDPLGGAPSLVLRAQQTLSSGLKPTAGALADVNGDGKLDLVTSSDTLAAVSVALGNGDGTFKSPLSFAVTASPKALAVADVTRDGKADLILVTTGNTVSVLAGNGDGTFAPQVTYLASGAPYAVAVADVNGDGILDVATADKFGAKVSLLLGNSDGTFAAERTFAVGAAPDAILAVDMNSDGRTDLVVANGNDNDVSVLLGLGNGDFVPQATYAAGINPVSLAAGDVNGDGNVDVVAANNLVGPGSVSVLLGTGSGELLPQQTFAVGRVPTVVMLKDLNNDGKLDLIVSESGTPFVSNPDVGVMLGNGDGTFGVRQTLASGAGPRSLAAGDLNGDGMSDLVVVNSGDGNVGTFLSGNGFTGQAYTIVQPPQAPIAFLPRQDFRIVSLPDAIATGDFNGDGNPDLVATGRGGTSLGVILGNADGTFGASRTYNVGGNAFAVAVADVNGDGRADVVATSAGAVNVMLGNGDGTFGAPTSFAAGTYPRGVAVADVNGDGKQDLLVTDFNGNSLAVLLGNGDGTFAVQTTYVTGGNPERIAIADLNGDGHADVVVVNNLPRSVGIFMGNGDGTFQGEQTTGASGYTASAVAIGDVNGDGKPDLLVASAGDPQVDVLTGNGNGTFKLTRTVDMGQGPSPVVVADVNGDGKPDLVAGNFTNYAGVALGNGDGTFTSKRTFGNGGRGYSVAVADFNHDGRLDVATANDSDGTVSVLLNDPPPTVGSIDRTTADPVSSDPTLSWSVTFSKPVVGVDASDFQVVLNGVVVDAPAGVAMVNASTYTVTVNGIPAGGGTVGVNLVNNGSIADAFGSPLATSGGGNFIGQQYTLATNLNSIAGTAGVDTVSLTRDQDQIHIDWVMGSEVGQISADDPAGLTVNGLGGNDIINLDYSNGNPLPALLKLNQPQGGIPAVNTLTINGMDGTHLLSGTTLDIGTSNVFIKFANADVDPISLIRSYLTTGRGANTWTGTAAVGGGSIKSSAAALSPSVFSIGYADSVTDPTIDTTANSIELMYTIAGDANLDGKVTPNDFSILAANFNLPVGARWSQGDFNYDDKVTPNDFGILASTFGQVLLTAGGPAAAQASLAPAVTATTPSPTHTPTTAASDDSDHQVSDTRQATSVEAAASTTKTNVSSVPSNLTSNIISDSTDELTGLRGNKNKKRDHRK